MTVSAYSMSSSLLLIFVKNPELGKVKTRLAATIGNRKALRIYLKLLEHTRTITQSLPYDKVVYYSPAIQPDDIWGQGGFQKSLQREGDLGQRMQDAFQTGFTQGYEKICIIGSDCYELTSEIIQTAYQALDAHDVIVGPSLDGGYYLLGMKELHPELFQNKHWSTSSVLKDTITDLTQKRLQWTALPELNDVDEEGDLETMK